MTPSQAEKFLEDGCPHNAWTDDICGNCAKDILEVFLNLRHGQPTPSACKTCGDPTHSTSEHASWTRFDDNDE